MIEVSLEQEAVAVGETVKGRATVVPENDRWKEVVVWVGWHTEGRGDMDKGELIQVVRAKETFTNVLAGMPLEIPFEAKIPEEGPISYDGEIVRIVYSVEVRVVVPLARDEKHIHPFRVHAGK